jgi:hypothetical protein
MDMRTVAIACCDFSTYHTVSKIHVATPEYKELLHIL